MIRTQQMANHDYDWFCIINDMPVCLASNGGFIPHAVNKGNRVVNMQARAYNLPRYTSFHLNTAYITANITNSGFAYVNDVNSPYRELLRPHDINFSPGTPLEVQYYSEYFAKMAERGLYVLDRIGDDLYSLIAWPENSDMELLHSRLFRDDAVFLEADALDFTQPETLVEINIIDLFVNI